MATSKLCAIGDIHGTISKLDRLLNKIFDITDPQETTYIQLGDVVDGGKQSRQCIDRLMKLKEEVPNTVFLMGNHEDMLLNAIGAQRSLCAPHIKEGDFYLWYNQGGKATAESYIETMDISDFQKALVSPRDAILPRHVEWMKNLDLYYETDKFIFVHAGLKPGLQPIRLNSPGDMMWLRDEFIDSDYDWGKRVIFGHTCFPGLKPLVQDNKIGIDTRRHGDGELTAVLLDEDNPEWYEFIHS